MISGMEREARQPQVQAPDLFLMRKIKNFVPRSRSNNSNRLVRAESWDKSSRMSLLAQSRRDGARSNFEAPR